MTRVRKNPKIYPREQDRAQPTGPRPASWVARDRSTGRAVAEVFDETNANKLAEHFDVVPILQHLQELNERIANAR